MTKIIGYVFRILSSQVDPYRITFFVGQYFYIMCAPIFISAGIYVFSTRMSHWATEVEFTVQFSNRYGLKPPQTFWMFVYSDVVCTLLQVTGASLIGSRTSKQKDPTGVNQS